MHYRLGDEFQQIACYSHSKEKIYLNKIYQDLLLF